MGVVVVLATCGAFYETVSAPPIRADVPLLVLTDDTPAGMLPFWIPERLVPVDLDDFEAWWRDLQQRFAERSTRGRWRVVPHSGHLTANSQPHEVAEAVLDVLAETRRFAADTSPPQ